MGCGRNRLFRVWPMLRPPPESCFFRRPLRQHHAGSDVRKPLARYENMCFTSDDDHTAVHQKRHWPHIQTTRCTHPTPRLKLILPADLRAPLPHLPYEAMSNGPALRTLSSHLCLVKKPPTIPPPSWHRASKSATVPPPNPTANSSPLRPPLEPKDTPLELSGAVLTAAPPRSIVGKSRPCVCACACAYVCMRFSHVFVCLVAVAVVAHGSSSPKSSPRPRNLTWGTASKGGCS